MSSSVTGVNSEVSSRQGIEKIDKPQCCAFIPGLERFSDIAGILVGAIMAAGILTFALVYHFLLG